MRRLLPIALILLSPVAFAQTTLDITVPGGQVCSYSTGPVSNGSAPGHLQATSTSSSGAGCGSGSSGNVTFGPATPVAATPVTLYNGQSTISFQAQNANTKCSGSISPATGSFVGGGDSLCTLSGCAGPVTATAQFDNESTTQTQDYTVQVTCTGTGGQATSQVIVNVPKKGDNSGNCPAIANSAQGGAAFTRMTGTINSNRNDSTVFRDATSFDAIFGTAAAPHWPGPAITTNVFLPRSKYLSLAFTVPAGFYGSGENVGDIYGHYTVNASQKTANITYSISTKCGDFSPPGTPGSTTLCLKNNAPSGGYLGWWLTPGSACTLQNNTSYFLNVINADVSAVLPNGGGTATMIQNSKCTDTCEDPLQSGPNHYFYP